MNKVLTPEYFIRSDGMPGNGWIPSYIAREVIGAFEALQQVEAQPIRVTPTILQGYHFLQNGTWPYTIDLLAKGEADARPIKEWIGPSNSIGANGLELGRITFGAASIDPGFLELCEHAKAAADANSLRAGTEYLLPKGDMKFVYLGRTASERLDTGSQVLDHIAVASDAAPLQHFTAVSEAHGLKSIA